MPTFRPATCIEATTRCLLLSLGLDHIYTDFLIRTAIGAAAVLLTIALVGLRTRRR